MMETLSGGGETSRSATNEDNGSYELVNNEPHDLTSIKHHKAENAVAHAFTNAANLTSKLTSDLFKKMSDGSKSKKKNKEQLLLKASSSLATTNATNAITADNNTQRAATESNKTGKQRTEQETSIIPDNVSCMCESHGGKELINRQFNIPVDELFKLLFTTDSEFIRKFWAYRKLENVQVTDWCEERRKMEYTINFGGAFGQVKNFEDIRILRQTEKQLYVVESESTTQGVMYADYFSVSTRFCITRKNASTSNLLIRTVIDYKKQPNFIAKSFIEKNTDKAMKDCFSYLEKILQEESSKFAGSGRSGRSRSIRKNSILLAGTGAATTTAGQATTNLRSLAEEGVHNDNVVPSSVTVVTFQFMYWQIDQKLLLKCLLLVFIVLMSFNIRLYLKMSNAESHLLLTQSSNQQNDPTIIQSLIECQKTNEKDSHQVRLLLAQTLKTLKSMQHTFEEWDRLLKSSSSSSSD